MKISKGNVKNINRRIFAGTLAFAFLAAKFVGYSVVKQKKYSQTKASYIFTEEYAILPEKVKLDFNDPIYEINNPKKTYKKIKGNGLVATRRGKVLRK